VFDLRGGMSFNADSLRHAEQGDLDVLIVLRALGEGGDVDKGSDFE
jgi:hypothetical protein